MPNRIVVGLLTFATLLLAADTARLGAHGAKITPKPPPKPDPVRYIKGGKSGKFGGGPATTPVPASGPTTPGAGRGPITPSRVPGAQTGVGKKNKGTTSPDRWELWWAHNREPYLLLRAQPVERPTSGGSGFLTGMGAKAASVSWTGPTRPQVLETVIPALRVGLGSEEVRIIDSAALALAKVTPATDAALILADLEEALACPQWTVRQAAILGLGVLGSRTGVPLLWGIMNDTSDARDVLDVTGAVQSHERALAALALGFACGPEMVPHLERLIESTDDAELGACAVLSLGLMQEAATDIVPFLARLLADERIDRRIRAQVPISLGRLGAAATPTVPALLKLAEDRGVDGDLRRSAVIALGELAGAADREVADAMRRMVRKETGAELRHFAFMTLGRIGAQAERQAAGAGAEILGFLTSEIADPGRQVDLPWAVLATGIAGHDFPAGGAERTRAAELIASQMRRTRNPSTEGAMAVALGLLEAGDAAPLLSDRLRESSSPELKAYIALGLGLMHHREAADQLREIVLESSDPGLRVEAATALGMIGDRAASLKLLEILSDSPTYATTISIARALGQIGDRDAIEPLAALAVDRNRDIAVRSYSCVALGLIAEKTVLPWNTALSVSANYLTGLQTQAEVLDLF